MQRDRVLTVNDNHMTMHTVSNQHADTVSLHTVICQIYFDKNENHSLESL